MYHFYAQCPKCLGEGIALFPYLTPSTERSITPVARHHLDVTVVPTPEMKSWLRACCTYV